MAKTNLPTCTRCGEVAIAGRRARFCALRPGMDSAPAPQKPWAERLFSRSTRLGFQFEGYLSPKDFSISRIISYRNCCIPVLRGRFEPTTAGTRAAIDMKMNGLGYVPLVPAAALSFIAL